LIQAKLYARGSIETLTALSPILENFADDSATTEKVFGADGDDSDADPNYSISEEEALDEAEASSEEEENLPPPRKIIKKNYQTTQE
jgi:hypothetical protein